MPDTIKPSRPLPLHVASATRIVGLHWKNQGSLPPDLRQPTPPAILAAYRTVGSFFGPRSGSANKGKIPSPEKLAQLAAARSNPRPSRQTRSKLKESALSLLPGSTWTLHLPHTPKPPPSASAGAPILSRSPYNFPFLSGSLTLPNGQSFPVRLRFNLSGSLILKSHSASPSDRKTKHPHLPSSWSPAPPSLLTLLPPPVTAFLDSWLSTLTPKNLRQPYPFKY